MDENNIRPLRVDYINFLIGYFVFHGENKINEQKLVEWCNSANFTNKSNTARRKMYSDLLNLE